MRKVDPSRRTGGAVYEVLAARFAQSPLVLVGNFRPGLHFRYRDEEARVSRARQIRHRTASTNIRPCSLRKITNHRLRRIAFSIFSRHPRKVGVGWSTPLPLAFEL